MIMSLFAFILGSSLASFLCVVVTRLKRNESIIFPQSHCDNCQTVLHTWELIPVLSYITLRGKCSNCSAKIPKIGFIAEISLGTLFILATHAVSPISAAIIFTWLTLLTLEDLSDQQLYQWETLGFMITASFISPTPFVFIGFIWTLSLIITRINYRERFIGNADIEIVLAFFLIVGNLTTLIIIFIACILALLFLCCLKNYRYKLPFIPFLSIAFIITTTALNIFSEQNFMYKKSIEIISRCFSW